MKVLRRLLIWIICLLLEIDKYILHCRFYWVCQLDARIDYDQETKKYYFIRYNPDKKDWEMIK